MAIRWGLVLNSLDKLPGHDPNHQPTLGISSQFP